MGSDNLFHRRKAKQARDLARQKAKRDSYEKVLIVTEGEKTEPIYFRKLKDHLHLNSANVMIAGESDSGPISVVDFAIGQYKAEKQCGDPFDRVYCVFDRDEHASYDQARQKIQDAKPKDTFFAITSVPCFEYWILLHFIYTTAQHVRTGGKSPCNNLIDELKKYLPNYDKNDDSVFDSIIGQIGQAKAYAARSLEEAQNNHDENPSTNIHELVEYLKNLKEPPEEEDS